MPVKEKPLSKGTNTKRGIGMGSVSNAQPKAKNIRSIRIEKADNGVTARTEYEYDPKSNNGSSYGPDTTTVHEGVSLDDVKSSLKSKMKNIDGDDSLDPKEKRVAKAKAYMSHGQDRS